MSGSDDIIRFTDDVAEEAPRPAGVWKVAVIDDDRAVHEGTRYALYDYVLNGHRIELLSAFSASEGRELLRANPDIAVVLLDVVMETEDAGLELVGFIRNELKNETVRIVLRTGQPGQAPERNVIVDYDINDYKAKTELTADRLFTTITAALRGYQQLQRMAETRRGLEIIIDAASSLFDLRSMQKLAEGVLTQISSLLAMDCAGILVLRDARGDESEFAVLAASGCYSELAGKKAPGELRPEIRALIDAAFRRRATDYSSDRTILYVGTPGGAEVVVVLEAGKTLSDTNRTLIEVFCGRLAVAFDNVALYEQLQTANATLEKRVQQRTRELSAANSRLQAQWLRARRANAFQSEILGTVAHDIRNPLGVILGRTEIMSELIGRQPFDPDMLSVQVGHVRETANRLTAMVSEMITDAATDALDISLRRERVALNALVASIVEANEPLARRKSQTIDFAPADRIDVDCDIDRMRDAIDNLVSNAIKYSPPGGTISITVEPRGGEALLSVRDTGPGLMPEDRARLFGRFQRLSARPTGGEASTGLGLSIARKIVELHGGAINADSEGPGRGSTFTITLQRMESGGEQ